jgi:hypothetical protein
MRAKSWQIASLRTCVYTPIEDEVRRRGSARACQTVFVDSSDIMSDRLVLNNLKDLPLTLVTPRSCNRRGLIGNHVVPKGFSKQETISPIRSLTSYLPAIKETEVGDLSSLFGGGRINLGNQGPTAFVNEGWPGFVENPPHLGLNL